MRTPSSIRLSPTVLQQYCCKKGRCGQLRLRPVGGKTEFFCTYASSSLTCMMIQFPQIQLSTGLVVPDSPPGLHFREPVQHLLLRRVVERRLLRPVSWRVAQTRQHHPSPSSFAGLQPDTLLFFDDYYCCSSNSASRRILPRAWLLVAIPRCHATNGVFLGILITYASFVVCTCPFMPRCEEGGWSGFGRKPRQILTPTNPYNQIG